MPLQTDHRRNKALHFQVWQVVPAEVDCMLYILIISVGSSFTRRGIANQLLTEGLEEAKLLGCQGIVTEATATGSQRVRACRDRVW